MIYEGIGDSEAQACRNNPSFMRKAKMSLASNFFLQKPMDKSLGRHRKFRLCVITVLYFNETTEINATLFIEVQDFKLDAYTWKRSIFLFIFQQKKHVKKSDRHQIFISSDWNLLAVPMQNSGLLETCT